MHIANRLEHWLDCERDQLALWLPIALGTGIGAWFLIDSRSGWIAFVLAMFAGEHGKHERDPPASAVDQEPGTDPCPQRNRQP